MLDISRSCFRHHPNHHHHLGHMQRADHDRCPTDEPLPCRVRRLADYSVDARYLAFGSVTLLSLRGVEYGGTLALISLEPSSASADSGAPQSGGFMCVLCLLSLRSTQVLCLLSFRSSVFRLQCLPACAGLPPPPPSAYMSLHLEDFTLEELLAAACRVEERGGAGGAA